MNTEHCSSQTNIPRGFCRKAAEAIETLKARLQRRYELALAAPSEAIRRAISEAETLAWQTDVPHLLFPDLVEARVAAVVPARRVVRR